MNTCIRISEKQVFEISEQNWSEGFFKIYFFIFVDDNINMNIFNALSEFESHI